MDDFEGLERETGGMNKLPVPIEVLYLYADADEWLSIELEKHLSLLWQQGLITPVHKRQIIANMDWTMVLDQYLNTVPVILLLISPDFMADYWIKMQRAMERHDAKEALVIPVLLRSIDRQRAPFEKLRGLPSDERPVMSWPNRDEAFTDIARGIRNVLENIQYLNQNVEREGSAKGIVERKNSTAADLYHLTALLQRYVKVLEILHMDAELKDIQPLIEIINEQNFKILLIGEFNRGKTTVINALLGEKVFPAYPDETTVIINEIKWSARKHIVLYQGSKSLEIPIEDLGKYVVVKKGQPNNPYDRAELFWPLELCKNGVEIIDSPGLNIRNKERLAQTYSYLPLADAVIFVLDAQYVGSDSEMSTIEILKDMGHTDILFICNKINVIDPNEQSMVKEGCTNKFSIHTRTGEKYIFFLDAKGALDGRINRDGHAERESGIFLFEEALTDFLVNERETIKLLRPAQKAHTSIQCIIVSLADYKESLQGHHQKLRENVAKAEKCLDDIERHQQIIKIGFENFRHSKMKRQVRYAAHRFYQDQLSHIDEWVNEYEIQNPLTPIEFSSNNIDACKRVINEVERELSAHMSDAFKIWEGRRLCPLIDDEIDLYALQLNQLVRQFAEVFQENEALTTPSINVEKRFGDIFIHVSDNIENTSNITFGFGQILKLALSSGNVFAGSTILFNLRLFIRNKDGVNEKIKQEVGKIYKEQISLKLGEIADKIAEVVDGQFEAFQQNLDGVLGREIQSFRKYLQNALTAQIEGKAERKLNELERCREELKAINRSIEDMIDQLNLTRQPGKR